MMDKGRVVSDVRIAYIEGGSGGLMRASREIRSVSLLWRDCDSCRSTFGGVHAR